MAEAPETVAVVGAGAMGAGIAEVALRAGHVVLVHDLDLRVARVAAETVAARLVEAGVAVEGRITAASLGELATADVVVEAVVEDLAVKQALLAAVETVVTPSCLVATNTSSLSVDEIARDATHPGRVVGMHFFNPATRMRLVEVVTGRRTDPEAVRRATRLAVTWGKLPIAVSDSPGFVANRVSRPYYSESLLMLEREGLAAALVDRALEANGFPLGPCALMDLVGHDVSLAATERVWEASGRDPRYAPSHLQQRLVSEGHLGRKSGRGLFAYPRTAAPVDPHPGLPPSSGEPVVAAVAGHGVLARAVATATGLEPADTPRDEVRLADVTVRLTDGRTAAEHSARAGRPVFLVDRWRPDVARATVPVAGPPAAPADVRDQVMLLLRSAGLDPVAVPDLPGLVASRVVSLVLDEAYDVVERGVASPSDVDLAMTAGMGYPAGPFAMATAWGVDEVVELLDHVRAATNSVRYRVGPGLRLASGTATT